MPLLCGPIIRGVEEPGKGASSLNLEHDIPTSYIVFLFIIRTGGRVLADT